MSIPDPPHTQGLAELKKEPLASLRGSRARVKGHCPPPSLLCWNPELPWTNLTRPMLLGTVLQESCHSLH